VVLIFGFYETINVLMKGFLNSSILSSFKSANTLIHDHLVQGFEGIKSEMRSTLVTTRSLKTPWLQTVLAC